MEINRTLLGVMIVILGGIGTQCLFLALLAELSKNYSRRIKYLGIFLISAIIFCNFTFESKVYRYDYHLSSTYNIIKADNDKSLKGEGSRWKINISSNNEFNFYFSNNGQIKHKTVDFDFPIYEDQLDRMYLNEYSYRTLNVTKLFWILEIKWEEHSNLKEYELHMPKGQFEEQQIILN